MSLFKYLNMMNKILDYQQKSLYWGFEENLILVLIFENKVILILFTCLFYAYFFLLKILNILI